MHTPIVNVIQSGILKYVKFKHVSDITIYITMVNRETRHDIETTELD